MPATGQPGPSANTTAPSGGTITWSWWEAISLNSSAAGTIHG